MGFVLDRHSRLPFSLQVNDQAIAQLVVGRLRPGDRLPSVRLLAQRLRVSRTTAQRILEAWYDASIAEVRPRSGAYVARHAGMDGDQEARRAQETYEFLTQTLARARQLGLSAARLTELISRMDAASADEASAEAPAPHGPFFPLIATRDWYECVSHCLGDRFPARVVQVSAGGRRPQLPGRARYLLAGFYMHDRARELAGSLGCRLLFVRYNVKLFDRAMAIGAGAHHYIVTRDADNADSTRRFLATAYPEVDPSRYAVWPVATWLAAHEAQAGSGQVWATITAMPLLRRTVPPPRLHLLHPLLAPDFIDELRSIALTA
jgi:GntR family transcriptional regulator